jgi:hypothetical protein
VNGVPCGGFLGVSLAAFEGFIPVPGLGREIGEMMGFMDEFGYDGGEEGVVGVEDVSYSLFR